MAFIITLTFSLTLAVMAAYIRGGESIVDAVMFALVVSSPVIICSGLVYVFKRAKGTPTAVFYWPAVGAFFVNLTVGIYLLSLFLPDIWYARDLGEAGDYWLFFALVYSYKYLWVGLLAGALVPAVYYWRKSVT